MPMNRRSYVRSAPKRRPVQWGSTILAPLQQIPGGLFAAPLFPATFTQKELGIPTVMAIRGMLRVLNVGASGTTAFGAAGIIRQDDAATLFPEPYGVEASDNWMWHSFFWVPNVSGSSVEIRMQHFDIYAKANRKLEDQDNLFFIIQTAAASTANIQFFYSSRNLVKTP